MALKQMNLTRFAGAAVLLGVCAPSTWAQGGAIVPSGAGAPKTAPAVPNRVVATPPIAAQTMTDVSFRDVEVTEVLNMISQGFDVPMLIASDVSGIVLPVINLPRRTPEAAIQAIATAAGLKFRKQADGTYIIAKVLPDDSGVIAAGTSGFVNPFGPGLTPMLPSISGAPGRFDGGTLPDIEMPRLFNDAPTSARKSTHYIYIKNVPSKFMGFWLDPANNEMPVQLQKSLINQQNYQPKAIAQSALSVEDRNATRDSIANSVGGNFNAGLDNGNFNPYTQQRSNSELLANAQFNGGGGNNNRGGGGNNNNRGGGNNRGGNNRGGAGGGGVFDLPEGVDRVVAVDPQNALLVFGTDEGVRELTDTIQFLDRPLRQVEIETQFVSVNTAATQNFGIDYSTSQGNFNANAQRFAAAPAPSNGSFQLGFVRGNFQATLSALLSQSRAKVITAPRVLAINNLTASLFSQQSTPVVLTTVVANGGLGGGTATGQNVNYVTTNIGLTVTPTINNDGTITVLLEPQLQTQNTAAGAIAPTITSQTVQTIANVRDGDTIALGGLKAKNISRATDKIPLLSNIPLIGGLFRSKNNVDTEADLIIFVTARIVRRAEDDVPGT